MERDVNDMLADTIALMDMDSVIANSYKNFHVKGFDYICLRRSPKMTRKVYFFDGDVSQMSEIVSPHDHRYTFLTTCVTGAVENIWYQNDMHGDVYQRFAYSTPLNGGDGFEWLEETRLSVKMRYTYEHNDGYIMRPDQLHTIRMAKPETVIMLDQYEDQVPVGQPTNTFVPGNGDAPSLDGLYDQFTADEIIDRLTLLAELTGKELAAA